MKFSSRLFMYFLCALVASPLAQAQIIPSIPYNLTNGSLADATQVMGNFNTIVNDTNANSAKNGANTDITSLTGLTTPLANTYGGTVIYTGGTTGGSANAQTLAIVVPSNFALTAGNIVTALAGFTNSGATTLSVAGGAAKAMRKKVTSGLAALVGNEIVTGSSYMWYYDGTFFELLNPTIPTATVTGPGSSVSGHVATFNGTGGNVIQDGGVALSALALLASPAFTGVPTAPTAASNDSTTQLATTAFVNPANSIAASGYQTLPSGVIIQWGTSGTNGQGDTTTSISFPITFPNNAFSVTATGLGAAGFTTTDTHTSAISASGFTVYSGCTGFDWIAIGN